MVGGDVKYLSLFERTYFKDGPKVMKITSNSFYESVKHSIAPVHTEMTAWNSYLFEQTKYFPLKGVIGMYLTTTCWYLTTTIRLYAF